MVAQPDQILGELSNPNSNWVQVELFRLAHGRLPSQAGDKITQETIDLFCKKFDADEVESRTVDLLWLRVQIAAGNVKLTGEK